MSVRKPRRRFIKIKGQENETASERATRQAVRYIQKNPHFDYILRSIRAGTPNRLIAEDCIGKGIFDVNTKTAIGYLAYFKKANPQMCKPLPPDDPAMSEHLDLDRMFDGNQVTIDEETELVRLINLQKARLAIAYTAEKRINVLMRTHAKEIQVLGELIECLAKVRGKTGNNVTVNMPYGEEVKSGIRDIQQEEGHRQLLASMISEMGAVFNG